MSKEIIGSVFEAFYTTKWNAGRSGLYIVYNRVTQALNVTIKIESSTAKGTAFKIKIPKKNRK